MEMDPLPGGVVDILLAAGGAAGAATLLRRGLPRPRIGEDVVLGRWLGLSIGLTMEERTLHLHVLGPTGSGKSSSVLLPMILQDLRSGKGVTLLDAKGDLARRVAAEATALGRSVYLLDPGRSPLRVDPLAGEAGAAAEALVYALLAAENSPHPFYGPLGETLLRTTVLALKETGRPVALLDLVRFWQDGDFRLEVLRQSTDPVVRAFYRETFLRWSPKAQQEATMGLASRLSGLLANPAVRSALAAEEGTSLSDLLAAGGVFLAALPLERLGLAGRTLGKILLFQFQYAALSRPNPQPFHALYVDEFQEFAGEPFVTFLATARSYGVGAVLAHQNLEQIPLGLRAGILANARQRILLGGLPPRDLEELVRFWQEERIPGRRGLFRLPRSPWTALRVRRLARGRALVQRVVGGRVQMPVPVRLIHRR